MNKLQPLLLVLLAGCGAGAACAQPAAEVAVFAQQEPRMPDQRFNALVGQAYQAYAAGDLQAALRRFEAADALPVHEGQNSS